MRLQLPGHSCRFSGPSIWFVVYGLWLLVVWKEDCGRIASTCHVPDMRSILIGCKEVESAEYEWEWFSLMFKLLQRFHAVWALQLCSCFRTSRLLQPVSTRHFAHSSKINAHTSSMIFISIFCYVSNFTISQMQDPRMLSWSYILQ